MFCPKCGTLSFPSPSGDIACTNYKCGYTGPAKLVVKGADGKKVDLSKAKSKTQAVDREYEVIKDSDKARGVLTSGSYLCPKCDCDEVYSYLEQTRSMSPKRACSPARNATTAGVSTDHASLLPER